MPKVQPLSRLALESTHVPQFFVLFCFSFRFTFVVQVDSLIRRKAKKNLLFSSSLISIVSNSFVSIDCRRRRSSYRTNTNMFGGLPTPTETDAPDNVLTTGTSTAASDYQHPDCDGSPSHDGHLTTSQSAHITLRYVASFSFAFDPWLLKQLRWIARLPTAVATTAEDQQLVASTRVLLGRHCSTTTDHRAITTG